MGGAWELKRRNIVIVLCLMALALLPVFYLHLTALRAADDFYYSTFWMDGPAAFWHLTLDHYERFNGRALVHFVAQTVLAFPPVAFAAVNTALLVSLGTLAAQVQGTERRSAALPMAVLLFLTQLLLLPTEIVTQGLLWASASYNYMLPVFLTVLALWLLARFLETEKKSPLFLILFVLAQFAAGATTEQCGFMAVSTTGIYVLCWAIRTQKGRWKLLIAPLLAAVGWITVFLSPATQQRAEIGSSLEPETLEICFQKMTHALFSWDGILSPLLLAAILLVACLFIPSTRKKLNHATLALLTGGFATALIMLPTGNFDPRTMVPVSLVLLLVSARCAVLLLGLLRGHAPLLLGAGMLVLCMVVSAPLLAGATQNYSLELRNRAAVREARETGILHYCIDYDTRWCYPSLMFTDNSFYARFLQASHLEAATVYLESAHMKNIYLNGRQLSSPGYEQDDKVFFPLLDLIEGFGGTVSYSPERYTVLLDGQEVNLWFTGVATYTEDGRLHEFSLAGKAATRYYRAAYTADLFQDLFGVDISLAGDRYLCAR